MLKTDDIALAGAAASQACLPGHIAIIMDGNGRWAARRSLPRSAGHRQGVDTVRDVVRWVGELGVNHLTLFSFSSENWSRPPAEVAYLMDLLKRFIRKDLAELHRNDVKVTVIGRRDNLDPEITALIGESEQLTRDNRGLRLMIAFNYGSHDEMVRSIRRLAARVADGTVAPDDITSAMIAEGLDTAGIPDPDLVIRTGGEQRLSNFLLWQCAYAEFVFVDEFWPEFSRETLLRAVTEFQSRERRFGCVATAAVP
jgi:undecaprenyl diphosphate synthase